MRAKDVMSFPVKTISGFETVAEAMKKMVKEDCYSLIVEKRDEGDAYGIITRKDIMSEVISYDRDPKTIKVHQIMTKPLITVPPELEIEYVARLMSRVNVRRVPVLDGSRLVGIVSEVDIFRAYVKKILHLE